MSRRVGATLTVALAFGIAGCGWFRQTVALPVDAPLTPAKCAWPADTPLSFAGWTTLAAARLADADDPVGTRRVFALASRDAFIRPYEGTKLTPDVASRQLCAIDGTGMFMQVEIPDDWVPGRD
jgi:hypothetical protein